MKHYRYKIKPQFIEPIYKGIKKNEYRLNKPECGALTNGDRITLISNQNEDDAVIVACRGKQVYCSWEDALKDNWKEDFNGIFSSFDEALLQCSKFYSRDEIRQYGIVKINIEPVKPLFRKNRVLLDTNIIIHRESYKNVTFEVMNLYKWLDTLHSKKILHPLTKTEIEKYNDENIKRDVCIKLDSYETIIPKKITDSFFAEICNRFSQDENSIIDNQILFQVYDGLADLLITNDSKILMKSALLGIRKQVLSVDEYLKSVETLFPKKIDYKILSVKKEQFGNIDLNDEFFGTLKEDYPGFEDWFNSKNKEEAYVFNQNGKVHGFLYIKTEFEDEKDYLKVVPNLSKKKRLKVGTFKIDSALKGFRLSERFIKIIFDNALKNEVDEIYFTLFENKRKEVNALRDVLCKWGFYKHGYKISSNGNEESVFSKSLEHFDPTKTIQYNFPNLPQHQKMFILPINSEYHTSLFPDSILKNEDMSLYSENKGHLYSLEKIYVSGTFKTNPKPGDYVVIYRRGERYPKKYSSVCTCLCVLEESVNPKTLDDYLKVCSNKSVFSDDDLTNFYINKQYRTVIKLIPYKTYLKKISLGNLIDIGFIDYDKGPRPFDEVPPQFYDIFIKEIDSK